MNRNIFTTSNLRRRSIDVRQELSDEPNPSVLRHLVLNRRPRQRRRPLYPSYVLGIARKRSRNK